MRPVARLPSRARWSSSLALRLVAFVGALGLAACAGCASAVPLPKEAIALNAAGAEAIAQGDLGAAEARLSVAIEYSPRFVEAWVNLGYVELARGNFDEARRDFLKARDLNQDIPAPHHALGLLADRQGRGDEAEAHYRAALKVDPGFAPARANLGRRLFDRGQYENAREQFERLMQVAPDAVDGWIGAIETFWQLGRRGEASGLLARARDRFGDLAAVALLVARDRLEREEWSDAESVLAPLVGGPDRPRSGAAWAWIAVARSGRGDVSGAIQAAGSALAIDRNDAVARYVLDRVALASRGGIVR